MVYPVYPLQISNLNKDSDTSHASTSVGAMFQTTPQTNIHTDNIQIRRKHPQRKDGHPNEWKIKLSDFLFKYDSSLKMYFVIIAFNFFIKSQNYSILKDCICNHIILMSLTALCLKKV